jgi:hypothetical protein
MFRQITIPLLLRFATSAVARTVILAVLVTMNSASVRSDEIITDADETATADEAKDEGPKRLEISAPEDKPLVEPLDAGDYIHLQSGKATKANYQAPDFTAPLPEPNDPLQSAPPTAQDPCAAARFKPLNQLGIGIAQPDGQTPTDFATPCWEQINAGPNAACRCWPVMNFNWEATCLCYQPLYFEETNAERYGYVCGGRCCCTCIAQPAASAAHFFATIPALPYCLCAECPTNCVYTLGYYRPGSCVPWRWNWPPCDPYAAATTAAIYTGFIFAIP